MTEILPAVKNIIRLKILELNKSSFIWVEVQFVGFLSIDYLTSVQERMLRRRVNLLGIDISERNAVFIITFSFLLRVIDWNVFLFDFYYIFNFHGRGKKKKGWKEKAKNKGKTRAPRPFKTPRELFTKRKDAFVNGYDGKLFPELGFYFYLLNTWPEVLVHSRGKMILKKGSVVKILSLLLCTFLMKKFFLLMCEKGKWAEGGFLRFLFILWTRILTNSRLLWSKHTFIKNWHDVIGLEINAENLGKV